MKLIVFMCISTLYAVPIDNGNILLKPDKVIFENAKFNGSLVGNSTLMKFCCELWQRPIGNSVLFQVNYKTVDVITFKDNKCYDKDKECNIEICSCSNDEDKFQMEYWYRRPQAAKSQKFGLEILMKNNQSNIVTLTLWRYYDGKEFGKLQIAEEISQNNLMYNKDKTGNGLVKDADNIKIPFFILVTVIFILIVTLCMRCICRSDLHELLRKGRYVQLLANDSHEKRNKTSEATYDVASKTAINAAHVVHLSSIKADIIGDLASAIPIFTKDNSEERLNIQFISPNECSVDVKMNENSSAMSNIPSITAANEGPVVHLSSIDAESMGDVASAIPMFTWNSLKETLNIYWISPDQCFVDVKMKETSSTMSNVSSKTAANAAPVVHLSSIDADMMGDVASANLTITWDTSEERLNTNLISVNECSVDVKMKEYSSDDFRSNVLEIREEIYDWSDEKKIVLMYEEVLRTVDTFQDSEDVVTEKSFKQSNGKHLFVENQCTSLNLSWANEAQLHRNRLAEVFGVVNNSIQTMSIDQMIEHLYREVINTIAYPLNVVSFVRFGKTSFSKSIMINMKCSDQYQCTISTLYISPALCNEEVLRNELITSRKPMNNERRNRDISVLDDQFRRFPNSKQEMRNNAAESVLERPFVPLWQRLEESFYSDVKLNKNQIAYSAIKTASNLNTIFIPKLCSSIIAHLPTNGESCKKWSQYHLKLVYKSLKYKTIQEKGLIRKRMVEARQKQVHICETCIPFLSMFIDKILYSLPHETKSTVFVVGLVMFFYKRSRDILFIEHLERYKSKWRELKSAQDQKNVRLRHQLRDREYELAKFLASIKFEHFCREKGQMHEGMISCNLLEPVKYETIHSVLPHISSRQLSIGHHFEEMDGDTGLFEKQRIGIGDIKKLTLLNTFSGLQFAGSAGFRARDVFMQPVPILNKTTAYDYTLVMDIEGFQAPKLPRGKYSHDNNPFTLVISLDGVTIVNMKGENTSNVHDVLRIKLANYRLNLKKKFVFVHQNVSTPDANDSIQRNKFVGIFDEMPQAAKMGEKNADIDAFNQVIDFESEAQVWYFSDLWHGDSPMASVNQGFNKHVDRAKDRLFFDFSITQRGNYSIMYDTISRTDDLWVRILKDDFVFTFRDSWAIKEDNMERHSQSLTWTLENYFLKLIKSKAKRMLVNRLNDNDIENAFSNIAIRIAIEMEKQVTSLFSDPGSFVERGTLKDVMIKWTMSNKTSFELPSENFVFKAQIHISKSKEEIIIWRLKLKEKTNHEMEINELASNLVVKMQGKTPVSDTLKGELNHFWSSGTNQSGITNNIDFFSIASQIENLLFNEFRFKTAFFMHKRIKADLFYDQLRKLEKRISPGRIPPEYFNRIFNCVVLGKEKSENFRNETVHIINQTFRKIDSMLLDLDSQDIRIDISHVTEIMNIIVNDIDNHNDHTVKAVKKIEVGDSLRKLEFAIHKLKQMGVLVPNRSRHHFLHSWWNCDPTMAPASPGHSKCLNRVKDDTNNHNDHTVKAEKKAEVEDSLRRIKLAIHKLEQMGVFAPNGSSHHLLDSWCNCDPTMDPASPGHSKCLNRVKDALFCDSSMTQKEQYLTTTDTISRIEDLCIGILKDDFVFSLRNGLEVNAYNSMERRCQSRTWTIEKYVLECIWSQAKGMLATCMNDNDLDNAF